MIAWGGGGYPMNWLLWQISPVEIQTAMTELRLRLAVRGSEICNP